MDTTFKEQAHQGVEDVVALHEMDPGPSIRETLESMLSLGP